MKEHGILMINDLGKTGNGSFVGLPQHWKDNVIGDNKYFAL
jgi:hypothetical protein